MTDAKMDHPHMDYDDWYHTLADNTELEYDLFYVIYPTSIFQQVESFNNVMQKVECKFEHMGAILKSPQGWPE